MRNTIIFGNGIGMALDPAHFSLTRALKDVWDSSDMRSDTKELISHCIPDREGQPPKYEDDLDKLHLAISACSFLSKLGEDSKLHWLTAHGLNFPAACKNYINRVALDLHQSTSTLPNSFTEPLISFVRNSRSHIGTLNYDKLLYQAFIDSGILSGYSGSLVDGCTDAGFSESNLERRYGKDFGYYMHLHGSPLFYDFDNNIYKYRRCDDIDHKNPGLKHIVLTHIKHKPSVIDSSRILSTYWNYLSKSLTESCKIVLFGYSGCDNHLNSLLSNFKEKHFHIIEWEGAGSKDERNAYWAKKVNVNFTLHRLPNILSFTDWNSLK